MSFASLLIIVITAVEAAQPQSNPTDKAKAQSLLSEGVVFYAHGEMAPALEKFREAYTAYPSSKLLFNIGQASRELGRYVEAMESFEKFLAEAPEAPADMTAEAQDSVAVLKGKLGTVNLVCTTQGVEVRLDGKPIAFAPPSHLLWALPGNHQVTARHPGATPVIAEVDVAAGAIRTVVLQLELHARDSDGNATRPPKAGLGEAATLPVPGASTDDRGWLGKKWTLLAAGGAIAFSAGAVAVGLAAKSRRDNLDKSCGNASPLHQGCSQTDIDSVITLRNTANVFWGLAGAATVTAAILFYVEDRQVTVAPMAGAVTGMVAETAF
jgi:hypothetical protein